MRLNSSVGATVVLRVLIGFALTSMPGCDTSGSREFLGCSWDVRGMDIRSDGSYVYVDVEPPLNPSFFLSFSQRPYEEPGAGFELVSSEAIGAYVEVRHYRSTKDMPLE